MFVLLGSRGQIASQLARRLLADGHAVRVVGRDRAALAPLAAAGAELAVGDAGDPAFLADAFRGAAGVYAMTPPGYAAASMRAEQDRVGASVAEALRATRPPRVVHLSSVGAELARGTGPIEGLHAQEGRLDAIAGLDLLHLRPGAFFENLLPGALAEAASGTVHGLEAPEARIPMVATRDVAAVAARELVAPGRRGALVLHAPGHPSVREAIAAFGAAIDRPLAYARAAEADAKAGMRAIGFSADAAESLAALSAWLSTSPLASARAAPAEEQPTTVEAFAREVFAPAFAAPTARDGERRAA